MKFCVVSGRTNLPADEMDIASVLAVALTHSSEVKVLRWDRRPGGMYDDSEIPDRWKR